MKSPHKFLFAFFCSYSLNLSTNSFAQNVAKNAGFETNDGWELWGGQYDNKARTGSGGLSIINEQPSWKGAHQFFHLDASVDLIRIQGWMSTENIVAGQKPWEKARIAVEFFNDANQQVGGYPPVVGETIGDSKFQFYENEYSKPEGASRMKVILALANCTGRADYDDMSVLLLDKHGNPLASGGIKGPKDLGSWYKVRVFPEATGSHYVDWSSLLDAPAGKHGFMKSVGDHLEFEDGTKIKFFGTNLVAGGCFPRKNETDSLVKRLSLMGCNLVRLHHMDAPWASPNIFGSKNNSRELNEASLEKLDYLIYKLKEKGIYVFLDLLVHRHFSTEDGVENRPPDNGGKQIGYFSKKVIELQKEYIAQLLTHENLYTGIPYYKEPAIAFSEFINESTVFMHFGKDILTEPYRDELQQQFEKAGNKGKKLAVFDYDWETKGTIVRKGNEGDVKETIEFMNNVEKNYYGSMKKYMRELGVKYPLAGSNFPPPILSYQKNNQQNDLIITNGYWDHPQLWKINNDWSRVLEAPIDNASSLFAPERTIHKDQAQHVWKDKPFIITEYNYCYPNEYILEGVPFTAAYGALQGYDGLLQFHFDNIQVGQKRPKNIQHSQLPEHISGWVASAPMFINGYLNEAKSIVIDEIDNEEVSHLPLYSDFLDKNFHLPYITKVAKGDPGEAKSTPEDFAKFYDQESKIITSETNELTLDYKQGLFYIEAPKIEGITGSLKSNDKQTKSLIVECENTFASVILLSADNQPIDKSTRLILVVSTPTKMKDDKFLPSRKGLETVGELPTMAQIFEGVVKLKLKASKLQVREKMLNGSFGKEIRTSKTSEGFQLNLAQGRSFVYQIDVTR